MVAAIAPGRSAQTHEEIEPLIALCKAGRLFDVQKWIAGGGPVNPPPASNRRTRKRSPLEYAMDMGFHSLVQVLLDGGASIVSDGTFCPMDMALLKRRFDMVQLLVEHGFNPAAVNTDCVFNTWDPVKDDSGLHAGVCVDHAEIQSML